MTDFVRPITTMRVNPSPHRDGVVLTSSGGRQTWQSGTRRTRRAENSHQRTRQREYAMRRFKSPGHASRFCDVHDPIYQHFRPPQHQLDAAAHRAIRHDRHTTWNQITGDLLSQAHSAVA